MEHQARSSRGSFAESQRLERRLKLAGLLGLFGFVWICLCNR